MSVNSAGFHPRNIYREKPDFLQLGEDDAEFKKHLTFNKGGKAALDFSKKESLRALTLALLRRDFGLEVHIPEDKLIPTLPLRLNYILWMEDLLGWRRGGRQITGIDIGCGASCIYPLLLAKSNRWKMVGTECKQSSFLAAQSNVQKNNLQDLISVVKVEASETVLGVVPEGQQVDFCMCNPPFFGSLSDANSAAKGRHGGGRRPPPKAAFSGSESELFVAGGEVALVGALVAHSKLLGRRVSSIYSSMLGHKKHLRPLKQQLLAAGVSDLCTTTFCQGNTSRWAIAWTFCPQVNLSSHPKVADKKLMKPVQLVLTESEVKETDFSIEGVTSQILSIFKDLKFEVKVEKDKADGAEFVAVVRKNTWSHQRRKRRFEARSQDQPPEKRQRLETGEEESLATEPILTFKTLVHKAAETIEVQLTWEAGSLHRDALHQILVFVKKKMLS